MSDEARTPDPLGPARPLLVTALRLGHRAAAAGDHDGAYLLCACAARLARKVRGLGEVADFRLEHALEVADDEDDAARQVQVMRAALEGLTDVDDPEAGAAPVPADPLAAAQALIDMAISIGAPAYNTGDCEGCYDVYACTARLILATVTGADEARARLQEALEQCEQLDDPDEQAWAMRHAFDAVGEMGPGAAGVPPREVRIYLSMAIQLGAPAFNLGDHRGCYEVYACTARLLIGSSAVPDEVKAPLRQALEKASTLPSVTRQAWVMRETFDAILDAPHKSPTEKTDG